MRLTSLITTLLIALSAATLEADDRGRFAKWAKIELTFTGPTSAGRGDSNPFAVQFDVTFTGPNGATAGVPGFYDGDGRGGLDGNVWKVRFSADQTGPRTFTTSSSHPLARRPLW